MTNYNLSMYNKSNELNCYINNLNNENNLKKYIDENDYDENDYDEELNYYINNLNNSKYIKNNEQYINENGQYINEDINSDEEYNEKNDIDIEFEQLFSFMDEPFSSNIFNKSHINQSNITLINNTQIKKRLCNSMYTHLSPFGSYGLYGCIQNLNYK
jgi:hypothetical protein